MKNSISSRIVAAAMMGAAVVGVAHSAAAAAQPIDDEMRSMEGEFELGNGDKVMIAYHRREEVAYRICVKDVLGADVPLNVLSDGKVTTIMDGTCADVVGHHIDVMPAIELSENVDLIGRYKRK